MNIIDLQSGYSNLGKYKNRKVKVEGFLVASSSEQYFTDSLEEKNVKIKIERPFLVDCIVNYIFCLAGGEYSYYNSSSVTGVLSENSDGSFSLDNLEELIIKRDDGLKERVSFDEIKKNAKQTFDDKSEDEDVRLFALRELNSFYYKSDDLSMLSHLLDILRDENEQFIVRYTAYECLELVSTFSESKWPKLDIDNNNLIAQVDWEFIKKAVMGVNKME